MTVLHAPFVTGIDIGGTHLRAADVDVHGKILASERRPITQRDPESLLEQIADAIEALRTVNPYATRVPIGLGLAGQLNTHTGVVAVAPNLGWRNIAFGAMFVQRFGQPVRLVNDLNAITVGESVFGAGHGAEHVACVFVGTGVGMGAVAHGILLEGVQGVATELGHIKVDSPTTGRACGCGELGCLEAYCSGRHLPALFREQHANYPDSSLMQQALADPQMRLGADTLEAAARAGDLAAIHLWEAIGARLGCAIGNVITIFNSQILVLGGGVLRSAPSLEQRVIDQIRATTAKPALSSLQIRHTALGEDAGVLGAASIARRDANLG